MILNKIALKKGSKKLINAWAFYDWANSVYSLVISSAIFPIYYGLIFSEINFISFRNPSEISLQKSATPKSDLPKFILGNGV